MTADIRAWQRRMDRALSKMDIAECARVMMEQGEIPPQHPEVFLAAMHKARIERVRIEPKLRLESVEWLRTRGYKRRGGIPLPPPGVLPT